MRSSKPLLIRYAPSWRTLLSALLIGSAFPPWNLGVLVWVALVPWLSGLKRIDSWRGALVQGFWLSFLVGVLGAYWLSVALHEFLSISWPIAVLGLLLFASTCAQPHLVLFAPLFRWIDAGAATISRPAWSWLSIAGAAALYAGLDWLVPRLFDVGLGYALHDASNLRQLADLGGVPLLTFWIALVNILGWQLAESAVRQPRAHAVLWSRAVGGATLWCVAFGYGVFRNQELVALMQNPVQQIRVGLVQGNVPNDVRLAWARGDDGAAEKQLAAYMQLTERFIAQTPRPDLVVWPEATFPGVFRRPGSPAQEGRAIKFDRQVLRLNVPIVFGAYDTTEEAERPTIFNALFAITPSYERPGRQGLVQRYRKHELLPFAEAIPGISESDWLHGFFPSLGFFGRGPGADVFRIQLPDGHWLRASPIICSESLASQHVIEGVRLDSHVILNVGSDGWFGATGEPDFHLAISRFRSIETRRPQIRAANTGISALILPNGEIADRSELGVEQTLELEVPVLEGPKTLMVRWGDWFGPTSAVLALGFVVLHWMKHRTAD